MSENPTTLALGIDIVEIGRIQALVNRWGERFLKRCFTTAELDEAQLSPSALAVRFAAKEACFKALGGGQSGLRWTDLEIVSAACNQLTLKLYGSALEKATTSQWRSWKVSLSSTQTLATAMVTAVKLESI